MKVQIKAQEKSIEAVEQGLNKLLDVVVIDRQELHIKLHNLSTEFCHIKNWLLESKGFSDKDKQFQRGKILDIIIILDQMLRNEE